MATTALGIAPDTDGNGVDPLTHRKCIEARWDNTGLVTGLQASGRSDLRYDVSAGVAVCSRSGSDGYTEAYWEGGATAAVGTGDSSNPRIDLIYVKANDPTQGDADNRVSVGAVSGTPGPSPSSPSVPAGAVAVAAMLMPAGATSTRSAQPLSAPVYAIPHGSTLGLLGENVRNYEGPANYTDNGQDYFENPVTFTVPTRRLVEFRFTATACCARPDDPSKPTENATNMACWYVGIQLDGNDVMGGGGQFQVSRAWEPVTLSVITRVEAGTHTARTRNHRVGWGENVYFVAHSDKSQTYQGRTLQVWDRGVTI